MFLWTVAPPLLKHWPQCPVPCLDICLEPWSLSRIKEYERCSAATRTPEDPHHYSGRELELSSEVSLPFVSRNSGTVAQPFWTWRCYCWLNRLLGCADSCRMTNLLAIMTVTLACQHTAGACGFPQWKQNDFQEVCADRWLVSTADVIPARIVISWPSFAADSMARTTLTALSKVNSAFSRSRVRMRWLLIPQSSWTLSISLSTAWKSQKSANFRTGGYRFSITFLEGVQIDKQVIPALLNADDIALLASNMNNIQEQLNICGTGDGLGLNFSHEK